MAKKKNKNGFSDVLADFDEMEEMIDSPAPPAVEEDEEIETVSTQKGKKGKKDKKKGKKDAPTLDDLDEFVPMEQDLQWNEDDEEEDDEPVTKKGGKKAAGKKADKKADKKGKAAKNLDLPDLDDLEGDEAEEKPSKPAKKDKKDNKKDKKGNKEDNNLPDLDELNEDQPAEGEGGEEKLTKKQLARLKKEQAKKAEKEKKQAQQSQAPQQPKQEKKAEKEKPKKEAAPKAQAPPKKLTGALAAIKKQQEEKLRRERELQELLEQEERERQEAEALLQAKKEEEKRKREEEKRRIEEEIAEQKRLGTYMTEQQKAKIEKQRQQMIAMLEKQGKAHLIDQILAERAAREKEVLDKKNRFIERKKNKDDKKKKKEEKPKHDTTTTTTEVTGEVLEKPKPKPKPAQKKVEKKKKEELSWDDMLSDEEEQTGDQPETNDDELNWDDEAEEAPEEKKVEKKNKLEKKAEKKEKKMAEKLAEQQQQQSVEEVSEFKTSDSMFRNPICCVLGHVDTGKTKTLDRIRSTNVQGGEAGGITQQIGATYVPAEAIKYQTQALNEAKNLELKVPGLLIIDTPGHESFTNLRSRGTSLCDIAILVVDILHGLERQTLESIELLRKRKCPFVVALNKIDTIYGWKSTPNAPIKESLKKQSKHVTQLFDEKVKETITLFAEQGLNACLYYKNRDFKKYVSLVPTSAVTGEGIPDLLMLMCLLTQNLMSQRITFKNTFECTVLEVKVVEGHGHTVDVILSNGVLTDSDTIVLCGLNGPIVTKVRALLTPKPLREMRVKGEYINHKEIKASMGIKIAAQNLDQAVPGTQLLVVKPGDDIEDLKEKVMEDFSEVMSRISTTGKGVYVASSTLGSLEALLSFLKDENIPVAHISIGPVHKRDVTVCMSMKEKAPEYAMILAFDVPITKEAQDLADKEEITIFSANIIYHLFDHFTAYQAKLKEEKKQAHAKNAIWPCILSQTGDVFHAKQPITIGVTVEEGELRVGTPCVALNAKGEKVDLGTVTGIQHEKKSRQVARAGEQVAVSFDSGSVQHGRHFTGKDMICSKIHRGSIEAIKSGFKEELLANNQYFLKCIVKVKAMLGLE